MNTTPGSASWSIDAQTPRTMADAAGNVTDGYQILFTTGEGHHGQVYVPHSQYTVDKVRAAIQAQADNIDAIGALTSDGGGY